MICHKTKPIKKLRKMAALPNKESNNSFGHEVTMALQKEAGVSLK